MDEGGEEHTWLGEHNAGQESVLVLTVCKRTCDQHTRGRSETHQRQETYCAHTRGKERRPGYCSRQGDKAAPFMNEGKVNTLIRLMESNISRLFFREIKLLTTVLSTTGSVTLPKVQQAHNHNTDQKKKSQKISLQLRNKSSSVHGHEHWKEKGERQTCAAESASNPAERRPHFLESAHRKRAGPE